MNAVQQPPNQIPIPILYLPKKKETPSPVVHHCYPQTNEGKSNRRLSNLIIPPNRTIRVSVRPTESIQPNKTDLTQPNTELKSTSMSTWPNDNSTYRSHRKKSSRNGSTSKLLKNNRIEPNDQPVTNNWSNNRYSGNKSDTSKNTKKKSWTPKAKHRLQGFIMGALSMAAIAGIVFAVLTTTVYAGTSSCRS